MSHSISENPKEALREENKKYLVYFNVAVVLISVMFVEMVLINFTELSMGTSILVGIVYGLVILKFVTLLTWFMHLRWEHSLIQFMFIASFILALGTVAAVMAIILLADNML